MVVIIYFNVRHSLKKKQTLLAQFHLRMSLRKHKICVHFINLYL